MPRFGSSNLQIPKSVALGVLKLNTSLLQLNEYVEKLVLAIVKIDKEKAFDRVNWEFLQRILERMNFGPTFGSFILSIYTQV